MSIRSSVCAVMTLGLFMASSANAALVAWWNFNDGSGSVAADASSAPVGGSANNGTLTNFTGTYWNTNLMGANSVSMPHGLYFAGGANQTTGSPAPASPLVDLSAHLSDFFTLGTGTLSVWYRADTTPIAANVDEYTFLGIGTGPANAYNRVIIQDALTATAANRKLVKTDHQGVASDPDNQFAETSVNYASTNDGNWHHLAYTSSGASSQFYIDGVAVGAAGSTGFLSFNPDVGNPFTTMFIGATQRVHATNGIQTQWYFKGTMGDFRIYDEVLGAEALSYVANPNNYGNGLVPEPSAFIMSGIGVIGMAWTTYRRRAKPQTP